MGDKAYKTVEILFFGAGKKGKYWLEYCRNLGMVPKGIIDNNKTLWGNLCEGITVYSPDHLRTLSFEAVFITCGREEEIYRQLLELGTAESKIVTGAHNFINHFLYYADPDILLSENTTKPDGSFSGRKILYDLQNGMVLGGVEAWVYGLAKVLKENGCQGIYLAADAAKADVSDETCPAEMLKYGEFPNEKDQAGLCLKKIIENLPCTIVCNFPQTIFWSACTAKRLFPDMVRIAAVQHSDDQVYYETYGLWKDHIDKYLTISSCMEKKLLASGMEKNKLFRLEWKTVCEEKMDRTWNAEGICLQIGYAGRITTVSKRADLLPVLAAKLRERGVCFRMNIAGTGEYSEILRQRIREEGLQEYIMFVGYIERKDIPLFWKKQDIMVSCSEREGHSISQSEAMAGGAVPVITNVSGAEDDVTDGYNGYIVETGDVDGLADRICSLYHDRDKLKQMGRNAHDTIYRRQEHINQAEVWKGLLEEVWRR